MNKDKIKGKAKDIKGRIKRQAGEWTGDEKLQAEGVAEQVEGKVQHGIGEVKDAGKKMMRDLNRPSDSEMEMRDEELREEPRSRRVA
jgi:uncharacterized protein YjbJ (UPF0337 family)